MKLNQQENARVPLLAEGIEIIKEDNGLLMLRKGSESHSLNAEKSAIALRVIEQLNGKNDVNAILKQLNDKWNNQEILSFFRTYGGFLFKEKTNSVRKSFIPGKKVKLLIIGKNKFAKHLRKKLKGIQKAELKLVDKEALSSTQISEETLELFEGTDLCICVPGNSSYELFNQVAEICRDKHKPCLFATMDPGEIIIGPSFIPGVSACFRCSREALYLEKTSNAEHFFNQASSTSFKEKKGRKELFNLAAQKLLQEAGKLLGVLRNESLNYLDKLESLTLPLKEKILLENEVKPISTCHICDPDQQMLKSDKHWLWIKALTQLSFSGTKGHPGSFIKIQDFSATEHPDAIQTIGVVGGGTAGYLSALAIKMRFPHLKVSLIESSSVPIIGVGEATTPLLNFFLFKALQFDIREFYQKVRPTWKLGIRFFWGFPGEYYFNHPFGLGDIFPSWYYNKNINQASLTSIMMSSHTSPVLKTGATNQYHSLLHRTPHALHLDNQLFVSFLQDKARLAGVEHINALIDGVKLDQTGTEVQQLQTEDGRLLNYDLYIDCSGFRSLLMEKALGSPFVSYEKSLFTDRAVVTNVPHGGRIKPYTLADSMLHGWTWGIPLRDSDHRGYVYSSSFCSDDDALEEMQRTYPEMGPARIVKFRSGRHQDFWKGNVIAIGNAYGFVEPLESTGIHMIIQEIMDLVEHFPQLKTDTSRRNLLNKRMNNNWDFLRWFLAIHYKYNKKFDSPFWKTCRNETDISGVEELVAMYREIGPLSYQNQAMHDLMTPFKEDIIFGSFGFDLMLLGQGVEPGARTKVADGGKSWKHKVNVWNQLTQSALTQEQALEVLDRYPDLLHP